MSFAVISNGNVILMNVLFSFSEMVTAVTKTSASYDRLLDEMKLTTQLIRNMTTVLDRQNALIASFDVRTAVAIIKLKNEMISATNRSVATHEEILEKIELVKKQILDFLFDQKEKEKSDKMETVVREIVDIEKGNFSDFDIQKSSLFQTMTLNMVDGKIILTLSAEPAPIAFVDRKSVV